MRTLLFALLLCPLSVVSCVNTEPAYRSFDTSQIGHVGSGILFPDKLGEFERTNYQTADEAGLDVNATYTRFHLVDRINANIFVFPAPTIRSDFKAEGDIRDMRKFIMEREFEGIKHSLLEANPGAELMHETALQVPLCGKECDSIVANYRFTTKVGFLPVTFYTSASVTAINQWLVLIRITTPRDSAARSSKEIMEFGALFLEANGGDLPLDWRQRLEQLEKL